MRAPTDRERSMALETAALASGAGVSAGGVMGFIELMKAYPDPQLWSVLIGVVALLTGIGGAAAAIVSSVLLVGDLRMSRKERIDR